MNYEHSLGSIRQKALRSRTLRTVWGHRRRQQQMQAYIETRERYAAISAALDIEYSMEVSRDLVQKRMSTRGYTPRRRDIGDIHTFVWLADTSWHASLLPALRGLGKVSRFDYRGLDRAGKVPGAKRTASWRQAVAQHAYAALLSAHKERPVDWVFCYSTGYEMDAGWPGRVAESLGVPVVNMCLDDKHSWSLGSIEGQDGGQVDIAAAFDLTWTSSRVAAEWYLIEGGVPLYMPEGFEPHHFGPRNVKKDIDVVFVGGAYGFRKNVLEDVAKLGIHIEAYGAGWGTIPVSREAMVELYNRAWIVLGMGGVGYDPQFTTLKGRDFEVPGSGGGMYLTSYNAELADCFHVSREIACYASTEEMVELIRYYLRNKSAISTMARQARERALEDHTWRERYLLILDMLGVRRG